MTPHYFQYCDCYSQEEFRQEFLRRVDWSYPHHSVSLVILENNSVFAWVSDFEYFEGSQIAPMGSYQRRITPSEVGM